MPKIQLYPQGYPWESGLACYRLHSFDSGIATNINVRHHERTLYLWDGYTFLEEYLFNDIHKNFQKRGWLTPEEFLAIVIWKRSTSKTNITKSIKPSGKSVEDITRNVAKAESRETKILILTSIKFIGIAIASAILTVLYPNEFTIIDVRARNSLKRMSIPVLGNPEENVQDYLDYVDLCKIEAKKLNLSLRDFDRALWGMDIYEGEKGLREISEMVKNTTR